MYIFDFIKELISPQDSVLKADNYPHTKQDILEFLEDLDEEDEWDDEDDD